MKMKTMMRKGTPSKDSQQNYSRSLVYRFISNIRILLFFSFFFVPYPSSTIQIPCIG